MTALADIPVLAVVVVREGELPAGAEETVAEAGGAVLVAGSGTSEAAGGLASASQASTCFCWATVIEGAS